MGVEILAIVPARGGSKGITRKNLRLLAGKPLLIHALEAARDSRLISRVVVSTDDDEICRLAGEWGGEVIERPPELAQDETPMLLVVQHCLKNLLESEAYQPEFYALLQPTAPLRRAKHVDEGLALLLESQANSVVSVCKVPAHYHPDWQLTISGEGELRRYGGEALSGIKTQRQELADTYTRNGALYAARVESFLAQGTLYPDPCMAYIMPGEVSVSIDSDYDLWLAEQLFR